MRCRKGRTPRTLILPLAPTGPMIRRMPPLLTIHFLPTTVKSARLAGTVAVMIDVLRASTTVTHALAAGCDSIRPCRDVVEARQLAAHASACQDTLAPLLAGERGGTRIDGFDLGNSPSHFTTTTVGGRTIIFTTTNGTSALEHCRPAATNRSTWSAQEPMGKSRLRTACVLGRSDWNYRTAEASTPTRTMPPGSRSHVTSNWLTTPNNCSPNSVSATAAASSGNSDSTTISPSPLSTTPSISSPLLILIAARSGHSPDHPPRTQ